MYTATLYSSKYGYGVMVFNATFKTISAISWRVVNMNNNCYKQARSYLYAKNQLLAHHFGKKKIVCLH